MIMTKYIIFEGFILIESVGIAIIAHQTSLSPDPKQTITVLNNRRNCGIGQSVSGVEGCKNGTLNPM